MVPETRNGAAAALGRVGRSRAGGRCDGYGQPGAARSPRWTGRAHDDRAPDGSRARRCGRASRLRLGSRMLASQWQAATRCQPGYPAFRTAGRWPGARRKRGERGQARAGVWLVWMLRIVLWAVALLIGYRGVAAIVMGRTRPQAPGATSGRLSPGQSGSRVSLGTGFRRTRLSSGRVYLRFSPATAVQRARSLSAFLAPGVDPELGWNGAASRDHSSPSRSLASMLWRLAPGRSSRCWPGLAAI